jgi:hypothetical protein
MGLSSNVLGWPWAVMAMGLAGCAMDAMRWSDHGMAMDWAGQSCVGHVLVCP